MDKAKAPYFLLLVALLLAPSAWAQTFGAQHDMLANGMEIVVIPNHRAPVVTHMVWFKVGSADEAPGHSGMAHYLEHLLFKGTAKMAPGEFSKTVRTLGGNDNAFTSRDYTAYFESVSASHLEKVMAMNADRMMGANPPTQHYESEKLVVLEERRQRTDNDPRSLFAEQMQSQLFVNHPYANPIIGWMNEIERYSWEDVKAFYERWYAPNNAILVISGDVTMEDVKPLAEKTYGKLPRKDIPKRQRPQIAPAIAQTTLRLEDRNIHQAMLRKIYVMPAEPRERTDSLALQVMAEILSGGPTTRLYDRLVVQQRKAINISLSYNAGALDYGTLHISATPSEGVTLEELDALIQAELDELRRNGVGEQETRDAIQRLQDQAVFARDSVSGPAMIFGAYLSVGGTLRDLEYWSQDIASITPEAIKEAAQRYLNPAKPWIRPPVTGHLYPATRPHGATASDITAEETRNVQ